MDQNINDAVDEEEEEMVVVETLSQEEDVEGERLCLEMENGCQQPNHEQGGELSGSEGEEKLEPNDDDVPRQRCMGDPPASAFAPILDDNSLNEPNINTSTDKVERNCSLSPGKSRQLSASLLGPRLEPDGAVDMTNSSENDLELACSTANDDNRNRIRNYHGTFSSATNPTQSTSVASTVEHRQHYKSPPSGSNARPSFLSRRLRHKEQTKEAPSHSSGADTLEDLAGPESNKLPLSQRRSRKAAVVSSSRSHRGCDLPVLEEQQLVDELVQPVSIQREEERCHEHAQPEEEVEEELHQRRTPLTAEQRIRLFGARSTRSSPAREQTQREQLVVATPVDMQAYHRQQEQRARPRRQQQITEAPRIPHAIPEAEFQAQIRQKVVQRVAFLFGFVVVILAAAIVMGFVFSAGNSSGGTAPLDPLMQREKRCFASTQELRDVAYHLMLLRRQNNYGPFVRSEIEQFYGPIEEWCVGNVHDFSYLFSIKRNPHMFAFNLNISRWNMSAATNTSGMFSGLVEEVKLWMDFDPVPIKLKSRFNQDISQWNVSQVVDMSRMFTGSAVFDQDLSSWDVSSVKSMEAMFAGTLSFNQSISSWDVGSVVDMNSMFGMAEAFDKPIGEWDVSSVEDMGLMFTGASEFNQDISRWDVSKVKNMHYTFGISAFNQDISEWDVSRVRTMSRMFNYALAFNQNLSGWNVSSVRSTFSMFLFAQALDQNLCPWGKLLPKTANVSSMFFVASSCPEYGVPDLHRDPPGPFCHSCD